MSAPLQTSGELAEAIKRKGWASPPETPASFHTGPHRRTALSANAVELAVLLGWSRRQRQLDQVMITAAGDLVQGRINEAEHELLSTATRRRRADIQANRNLYHARYGAPGVPRYDRTKAKDRRRGLLRLGVVPDWLANTLTPGEESAATVILQDLAVRGRCDKANKDIARLAGCCIRLVIRTKARLAETGVFQIIRRPRLRRPHETTVVRASAELTLWLRDRRPRRRHREGERPCSAHQNIYIPKERSSGTGTKRSSRSSADDDLARSKS